MFDRSHKLMYVYPMGDARPDFAATIRYCLNSLKVPNMVSRPYIQIRARCRDEGIVTAAFDGKVFIFEMQDNTKPLTRARHVRDFVTKDWLKAGDADKR
jgi:hypothetical protein